MVTHSEVASVDEAPWIHGNLRIPRAVLDVIEKAASSAYGREEEACGYLTGPLDDVGLCDQAVELENLANKYHEVDPEGHPRTGREYFKINARKFERAIETAKENRRAVKVFFHSHLDCGAYWSAEDAASMTMGGETGPAFLVAYLVTAVDEGKVTDHRLFIYNYDTKGFDESPFEVTPS